MGIDCLRPIHRPAITLIAAALLWQDAGAGGVKLRFADHQRISDSIPGTAYIVNYKFNSTESQALRIGDRVVFHCVLLSGGVEEAPCDSFDLTATLGAPGLPLAVEWAVLGNKWGVALGQPIRADATVLDSRFTVCAEDSTSDVVFRLTISELDTTGRSHITSEQKVLQQSILTLREFYDPRVAEDLRPLVAELGRSDFFRALYAEALGWAGQCVEYARQSAILAERGYGGARFSIQGEESSCSKWQRPPYELH